MKNYYLELENISLDKMLKSSKKEVNWQTNFTSKETDEELLTIYDKPNFRRWLDPDLNERMPDKLILKLNEIRA